jgi:transcriptional regulator with XRE-family HTH domain
MVRKFSSNSTADDRRYERYMRKNPRFAIDQIRENLGVTREELAIQMSTAPENVAELENKGMDISVWDLYYLLDGLGCDLEIHAKRNGKKMRLRFGPGPETNCDTAKN